MRARERGSRKEGRKEGRETFLPITTSREKVGIFGGAERKKGVFCTTEKKRRNILEKTFLAVVYLPFETADVAVKSTLVQRVVYYVQQPDPQTGESERTSELREDVASEVFDVDSCRGRERTRTQIEPPTTKAFLLLLLLSPPKEGSLLVRSPLGEPWQFANR